MARTKITRTLIGDDSVASIEIENGSIYIEDLNTNISGKAVVTKLVPGDGIAFESTGVDVGTGEVTITATGVVTGGGAVTVSLDNSTIGTEPTINFNNSPTVSFSIVDEPNNTQINLSADVLGIKNKVRLATTESLVDSNNSSFLYDNGINGQFATLTSPSTGPATYSIDGILPIVGDRILVKDQIDPVQNGIYEVFDTGTDHHSLVLTRATDADQLGELIIGTLVYVYQGTQGGNTYVLSDATTDPVNIGTDSITFSIQSLGKNFKLDPAIQYEYNNPQSVPYQLGGVIIGEGLEVDANGLLKVLLYNNPESNIQMTFVSVPDSGKYGLRVNIGFADAINPGLVTVGSDAGLDITNGLISIKTGSGMQINPTDGTLELSLPTASDTVLGGIKVGSGLSIDGSGVLSSTITSYTLPTASASVLGGIKVGSGLSIDGSGVLSASGGGGGGSLTLSDDTSTNASRYITLSSTTSGTLSAASVSSSKLYFNPSTGTLSATIFSSLSDISAKTNIETIDSQFALSIINQINPVSFNWKDTGKENFGVIAQEIEQLIPQIVNSDGNLKTVDYISLIPLLISAVQYLSHKLAILESK